MKKYTYNIERKLIENKLKKLKDNKADPNDVVLNAAAFQDQLLIDMGMKKKKIKINKLKPIKEASETVLPKMLNKLIRKELEYEKSSQVVIRQKQFLKNLTLAQKSGLKEIPKMPLSLNEWRKLEGQTLERQDHNSNCSICLESLFKRDSLILSCSHVFHKFCIQNFEKFTNSKKCPICRTLNYEAKDYYKDKEFFIFKSIIIIQKNFRGFILKLNLYRNVFKYQMPKNKHLRSLYSYWKIKDLTSNMSSIINKQTERTKIMMASIAKDVEEIGKKNNAQSKQMKENEKTNDFKEWSVLLKNIKQRKNDACAICLTSLYKKQVYLLNCSHCFHKNCLDSFEKYDMYFEKRCPICRRNYEKKEYNSLT